MRDHLEEKLFVHRKVTPYLSKHAFIFRGNKACSNALVCVVASRASLPLVIFFM